MQITPSKPTSNAANHFAIHSNTASNWSTVRRLIPAIYVVRLTTLDTTARTLCFWRPQVSHRSWSNPLQSGYFIRRFYPKACKFDRSVFHVFLLRVRFKTHNRFRKHHFKSEITGKPLVLKTAAVILNLINTVLWIALLGKKPTSANFTYVCLFYWVFLLP